MTSARARATRQLLLDQGIDILAETKQAHLPVCVCVRACANARARLPGALQPCMHAFFLRRGGAVPLGVQATERARVVG